MFCSFKYNHSSKQRWNSTSKKWPCSWELGFLPAGNRKYYWNAGEAFLGVPETDLQKKQHGFRDTHTSSHILKPNLFALRCWLSPTDPPFPPKLAHKCSKTGNTMVNSQSVSRWPTPRLCQNQKGWVHDEACTTGRKSRRSQQGQQMTI